MARERTQVTILVGRGGPAHRAVEHFSPILHMGGGGEKGEQLLTGMVWEERAPTHGWKCWGKEGSCTQRRWGRKGLLHMEWVVKEIGTTYKRGLERAPVHRGGGGRAESHTWRGRGSANRVVREEKTNADRERGQREGFSTWRG